MTEKDYNFDLEAPLGMTRLFLGSISFDLGICFVGILSIKVIGCVNTEKKGEYVHSIGKISSVRKISLIIFAFFTRGF